MLCKGIVTTVMSRHSHNRSCSISSQNILWNPNRNLLTSEWIDTIWAREDTCHLTVRHTFQLCALLYIRQILLYLSLLSLWSEFCNELWLWCQYHEANTKHRISTRCKDRKLTLFLTLTSWCKVFEFNLCTLRTANPVLLCLLDRVRPVDCLQSIKQSLWIGWHTKTPLLHQLLYDRIASSLAHTIDNLVISKHCAESRTPVYHRLTEVSNTIVHELLLLFLLVHARPVTCRENQFLALCDIKIQCSFFFKVANKVLNRHSLLQCIVIIRLEHTLESPLCPVVITWITGAYLTIPVETETYLIQLLTVTSNVRIGCQLWMLTRLNGILLSRKSVSIISHRVQHVETLQSLIACIDVTCNITQWVSNVQSGSWWIREHIKYIELLLVLVLNNFVGLILNPLLLPFLLNVNEVVFHSYFLL